jgi:hypothetical protein
MWRVKEWEGRVLGTHDMVKCEGFRYAMTLADLDCPWNGSGTEDMSSN